MGAWLNRLIREAEARGRLEGFKQGFEEGRQQAAVRMLRRGLQIRFGPLSAAHEDRLQELTAEEAEVLIERVFSAESRDGSIDEVLAG